MATPFSLSISTPEGRLVMTDGIVLVIFWFGSHDDRGALAWRTLEHYWKLVRGEPTLYLDRGDAYRRVTSRVMSRLELKLSQPSDDGYALTLRDGEEAHRPDHRFFYFADPAGSPGPNRVPTSGVELWFPTRLVSEMGSDRFVAEMMSLVDQDEFASAYCSLSLLYDDWATLSGQKIIKSTVARHPGIDVRHSSAAKSVMGEMRASGRPVRGAYWLTFLGARALKTLSKDAAALQAELGADIRVRAMRHGVCIQAGAEPEAGDVNQLDDLPLVRKVARVIEPVRFDQVYAVLFDQKFQRRWERRHVT